MASNDEEVKALLSALAGYDLHPTQKDQIMSDILAAGFRRVSPVTREDVQELIAEVRNYADKYRDNYQIKLADVMVRAAGALESLSVSPPAEVEWEYGVRFHGDNPAVVPLSESSARSRASKGEATLMRREVPVWVPVSPESEGKK